MIGISGRLPTICMAEKRPIPRTPGDIARMSENYKNSVLKGRLPEQFQKSYRVFQNENPWQSPVKLYTFHQDNHIFATKIKVENTQLAEALRKVSGKTMECCEMKDAIPVFSQESEATRFMDMIHEEDKTVQLGMVRVDSNQMHSACIDSDCVIVLVTKLYLITSVLTFFKFLKQTIHYVS